MPSGPDWIHEIKHDGYRILVTREDKRVHLFSRNGHDWTDRYPWIVEAALKNRQKHFVIDGEAVLLGVDGVSDFNGLHSRHFEEQVQLYAFDILALDGDDLRKLPLSMRKTNLGRLLARRSDNGIFLAPFESGEIGPVAFLTLCSCFPALAADLGAQPYTKAPPPIASLYSWTGFFVGGSIGYAWGRESFNITRLQVSLAPC